MPDSINGDWWKYTTTALASAFLVIATAWFTGASEWVTRGEAADMDHAVKSDLSREIDRTRAIAERNAQQNAAILESMGRLTERVNALIEEVRRQ